MDKQIKSFWKKYEFIIIIVVTLLFIYFLVFFNQKVNFFLGNELIVSLTPQQKSFSTHYGETFKAEFNVSIDNVAYCRASCSYSFTDISTNNIIDRGNFEIAKSQFFAKSYDLSIKKAGSGQDLYSFDVECGSIHSFLCLTKSPLKSRSSLVVVNYDLTETQKELKKLLRQNVTQLLEVLKETDILHQELDQKYFQLGFKANLRNLSREKIRIDDLYDKTRISIENLRSEWSVEDYTKLSLLFNQSYFKILEDVKLSIRNLNSSIDKVIGIHNELLSGLSKFSIRLRQLESFTNQIEDRSILNETNKVIDNFNDISSSTTNNTFESYDILIRQFGDAVGQQSKAIEKSRILSARLFFLSDYYLNYEGDLLCSLEQNCESDFSVNESTSNTEKFIDDYPNLTMSTENCESLQSLGEKFADLRNRASEQIADMNISFPSDSGFLALADNFMDNIVRQINNSYYNSFEKIKSENKTRKEVLDIIGPMLPSGEANLSPLNYNQSINLSLYLLSKINLTGQAYESVSKCSKLGYQIKKVGNFNFKEISTDIWYNITSKIETNLSDNPSICCVFNDCRPCCRDDSCKNDPKTFPVIFLHGHSFAKDNSPEFSLDAFNSLQSKLQADGYLNAGIVSLYSQDEQPEEGVWGLSGKPVTVKVSYYYDAFRKEDKYIEVPTKSENIDNYALRLKDLIGIVKQRTGKPKVDIIAHSMGGLVARRYIQIFGEDDIDKLVLIATPNKGISKDTSDYCSYVGENRECSDMKEDSLFMSKVNDPLRQPSKVKIYAVIGQGCDMQSGDSDGIVSAENAKLENAKLFYVNGTCGGLFGEKLHTEILDINKYPETYRIVKKILKE